MMSAICISNEDLYWETATRYKMVTEDTICLLKYENELIQAPEPEN
jgi:hypothetical protein